MKFGIRREVDFTKPDYQLSGLAGINIELALPYKMEMFLPVQGELPSLAAAVARAGCVVQSVHAPQGHLTDEGFHDWSLATAKFAESVGASHVVFHPEESRQDMRVNKQILAMRHIRQLQRETSVTVCIETFGSKKRIFRPEEICLEELPMCLDTSHLFVDRSMQLIEKYSTYISCVHLSEARLDESGQMKQHMPVQGYGFEILDKLLALGWNGIVTLEYLFEYHNRLIPDMLMLQDRYGGE